MTIKVGDRLPAGSLSEYVEVETAECKIGPNEFKVDDLTRGKKVVLFGLPGAFTPTCSQPSPGRPRRAKAKRSKP